MARNQNVTFVLFSDQTPPASLPNNLRFHKIEWETMQSKVQAFVDNGQIVHYDRHYKANDIKPIIADMYPQYVEGHEWWAWADIDVIFGDLLRYLNKAQQLPACCLQTGERFSVSKANTFFHNDACPCRAGEEINVFCPLYPNPWRKKAWGPFTAFRVDGNEGIRRYRSSPTWQKALTQTEYAHFDEWWGTNVDTMGDVITRLAERTGDVVISKAKLPFAEAKSCTDMSCAFCPCGALQASLSSSGKLVVNKIEVMLLHLAESKYSWGAVNWAKKLPAWNENWGEIAIDGLGYISQNKSRLLIPRYGIATLDWGYKLMRHRVRSNLANMIMYAQGPGGQVELQVSIDTPGGVLRFPSSAVDKPSYRYHGKVPKEMRRMGNKS